MESCEDTDFMYPMKADVYYPIVEQGAYGNVQKTWVFNKTIICNFSNTSLTFSPRFLKNTDFPAFTPSRYPKEYSTMLFISFVNCLVFTDTLIICPMPDSLNGV